MPHRQISQHPQRPDVLVRWLLAERVIFITLEGPLTPELVAWLTERIITLIHSCPTQGVHVVVDTSAMTTNEAGYDYRYNEVLRHPRLGQVAIVGRYGSNMLYWALKTAAFMLGVSMSYSRSVEGALEALNCGDPALPDLKALRADLKSALMPTREGIAEN